MEVHVYLQLTSSNVLIFDWKYLIIPKKSPWSKFGSMPKVASLHLFSPYNRSNMRQKTVQPKKHSIGKQCVAKFFYLILKTWQIIENKMPFHPLPIS